MIKWAGLASPARLWISRQRYADGRQLVPRQASASSLRPFLAARGPAGGANRRKERKRESVGGWVVVRVCVREGERERERKRPEYARWRERERQAANKELTYAPASTAQHIEGRMNAIQVQITK